MNKVLKYIVDKKYRFLVNSDLGFYKSMDDEKYLRKKYEYTIGEKLNLDNPKTFNAKLQWLKLNDKRDIYTKMVDKYEVKEYVSGKIGERYIVPTYGVWDSFDQINFDLLPNSFVLKCTHDSGGLVICRDKRSLDIEDARRKIEKCLKTNYFWLGREWPYKNVKPRIIAEKYLGDSDVAINDYKIYAFNGHAKIMMINQDRGAHTKADYFDRGFNELDFMWGYDHAEIKPQKPSNFDKMFELADLLSIGLPEIRVDFYEVNGTVYFGELTFYDGSGFAPILPKKWDEYLGDFIELPRKE